MSARKALRVAVGLDRRIAARLTTELVDAGIELAGSAASSADLVTIVTEEHPDAVVVSASRRTLTSDLIGACDAAGVRLVALAGGESERRHAAGLGLFEVLDAGAGWNEIAELLGRVAPGRAAGVDRDRGTVIAVWGPAGAPGRTTLAITLAAEIAALGHAVTLADVDSYGGTVAPALGMLDESPGFAAACRLAGNDALTFGELERVAQRYESPRGSFRVLTGIGRPTRWPELSTDRVARALAVCRSWSEYTIVDVGFSLETDEEISSDLFAPRRNAATHAALRASDRVVAVGLADPIGISRLLRGHVDLVETVPEHPIDVVVNRVRSSVVGLNPYGQVRSTLARFGGIESPILVPDDGPGMDAALATGRTLRDAAPRSPVRAAVGRLVSASIVPAPPSPAPRSRRLGRRAATAEPA